MLAVIEQRSRIAKKKREVDVEGGGEGEGEANVQGKSTCPARTSRDMPWYAMYDV